MDDSQVSRPAGAPAPNVAPSAGVRRVVIELDPAGGQLTYRNENIEDLELLGLVRLVENLIIKDLTGGNSDGR